MNVHPILRQIIGRDCHVSMSVRDVIRHVVSCLRDGYTTFREMPRIDRRRFIEECIECHRENVRLYDEVMNGQARRRKRTQKAENGAGLPPAKLSGRELVSLMRKHKVTIAALAFRTGITRQRIRQVRKTGLDDPLAVRDWVEAITGTDPGPIPEKYRIGNPTEETLCDFCGCPIFQGEDAYSYVSEVFCSRHCCRKSRGWH
jgi:hypothetical protein